MTPLRLRVVCHLPRLDAELAAGISPWRSDEHALRAAQLIARRRRARLARNLRRAVTAAIDDGPLYRPWSPEDLHAAAEEARHAL